MITSKKIYYEYLEQDRIALKRKPLTFKFYLINFFLPDYTWNFQRLLRKVELLKNTKNNFFGNLIFAYYKIKFRKLSMALGFSIPENVFGPGLAIVHYGNIGVSANAKIGKNCRIHVGTTIASSGGSEHAPIIGDNVYIGPGSRIIGNIKIPNNTAIMANSVVTKSFVAEGMLIGGIPAKLIMPINIKKIISHI